MSAERTATGKFLPGHTQWQGSGGGRKPLPDDLKAVKLLAPEHLERLITLMLDWDKDQFTAHMADPQAKMLDLMVGAIMRKAVIEGDPKYLDFIANKLLWRERQAINEATINVADTLKDVPKEILIAFLKERARIP